jgi:Spy/CpxP family protein refolding chaperone
MKRFISAALAAALLAPGIWAVSARAQDAAATPPQDGAQPSDKPADGDHHDGEGRGGHRMESRMKKRLGLTDEQAGKLKDAMKAHMDANKPFNEQMRSGMKTLHEQLKSKASDDAVQKTLDSLKAARKAMAEENEKFQDSLSSFLSSTQRAKMLVDMFERMGDRREGGDGDHRDHGQGGRHGDDHDDN